MLAVSQDSDTLMYASKRLQDDDEVVFMAVQAAAKAAEPWQVEVMKYASERLQDHKDLVMLAIHMRTDALKYASERLRSDVDVVLAAMQLKGAAALEHAGPALLADHHFLWDAISGNIEVFNHIPEALKLNTSFVLGAVARNVAVLDLVDDSLWSDEDFTPDCLARRFLFKIVLLSGRQFRFTFDSQSPEDRFKSKVDLLAKCRKELRLSKHTHCDLLHGPYELEDGFNDFFSMGFKPGCWYELTFIQKTESERLSYKSGYPFHGPGDEAVHYLPPQLIPGMPVVPPVIAFG